MALRFHLVVVQLLFSEDGLLVPHGDRGDMGGRDVVSHPLECCFPSAASGAPSPAPAALASPGAGSVASQPSLAGSARSRSSVGGVPGLGGKGGVGVRGGPKAGRSQGWSQGRRRSLGEGGGTLDLS